MPSETSSDVCIHELYVENVNNSHTVHNVLIRGCLPNCVYFKKDEQKTEKKKKRETGGGKTNPSPYGS